MTYKAYIHKEGKFPITDWAMSAYYGFKERKTKVILFDDLDKVPLSKFNIIVSGTENTIKRIRDLGIEPPKPLHIPEELNRWGFLGREIRYITFKQFKEDETIKFPIFIKPEGYAKQFIAGPVSSKENAFAIFNNVPDECVVMLSNIITIESEYRAFIENGKLVGLKHYLGEFKLFPQIDVIEEAITRYKSAPIAYTMDFGITKNGFTLLIECNDFWSVAPYGLFNDLYAGMLAKRWYQLMSRGF
jgi:hypothetical protein